MVLSLVPCDLETQPPQGPRAPLGPHITEYATSKLQPRTLSPLQNHITPQRGGQVSAQEKTRKQATHTTPDPEGKVQPVYKSVGEPSASTAQQGCMVACKDLGSWQRAASPAEVTIPPKSCLAAVTLEYKLSSAQLTWQGWWICGHHCPSRIVLRTLGDKPKAICTKIAHTSLASLLLQI